MSDLSVNGNKLLRGVTAVKVQSWLIFLSSYKLPYTFLLYLFLEPVETLQRWLFLLPPWHWHGWEFLYPSSPQLPAHAPLNLLSNSPRCSFCLERNRNFSGWKLNKSPRTEVSMGQQKQASKITVSKAWWALKKKKN